MKYIPIIIICILILAIIIAVYCGYLAVKRKAREVSRTLWGTDSLSEGVARMKREYQSTPKSVSAMTSLLLPKITADFPEFEYHEMRERAENVLLSYLRALTEQNCSLVKDTTTELVNQAENQIRLLKGEGLREHFNQVKIHRTEISQYQKRAGRCIITFQSAFECFHYVADEEGNVKKGDKDGKYQTKYNIDMVYIQDRNLVENELDHALGINCPNCGAPISGLGAKTCEYCGTPVVELNIHAWSFVNVEEVG